MRALVLPFLVLGLSHAEGDALLQELASRQRTTGLSLARLWGQEIEAITFDGVPIRKAFAPAGVSWYEGCFARGGTRVIGSTRKGVIVSDLAGTIVGSFPDLLGGMHLTCTPSGNAFALEATNQSGQQGLFLVLADKEVRYLSASGKHPVWSPDEQAVAYEDGGRIIRYDVAEKRQTRLTAGSLPSWPRQDLLVSYQAGKVEGIDPGAASPRTHEVFEDPRVLSPVRWSPDGAYVTYARTGKESLTCAEPKDVVVRRVRDGATETLTTVCLSVPYRYDWLTNVDALAALPTVK